MERIWWKSLFVENWFCTIIDSREKAICLSIDRMREASERASERERPRRRQLEEGRQLVWVGLYTYTALALALACVLRH